MAEDTKKLIVTREGREGLHIGDVVEVPADAESWPFEFAPLDDKEAAKGAKARAEAAKQAAEDEARMETDGAPALEDGDK